MADRRLDQLLQNEQIDNARRGILRARALPYVTFVPSNTTIPDSQDGMAVVASNGKLYYRAAGVWYALTGV